MDMKIFVDTDSDIRLARRMQRDISERGRDLEGVLKQYNKFVKPAFEHYIAPTMTNADIIVPRGGENKVAIDLIVRHVHTQLKKVKIWQYVVLTLNIQWDLKFLLTCANNGKLAMENK